MFSSRVLNYHHHHHNHHHHHHYHHHRHRHRHRHHHHHHPLHHEKGTFEKGLGGEGASHGKEQLGSAVGEILVEEIHGQHGHAHVIPMTVHLEQEKRGQHGHAHVIPMTVHLEQRFTKRITI